MLAQATSISRLLDHVAHGGLVDEDVVHRQVQGVRIDALRHRQVALGVHVDAQDPVSRLGERGGQVQGRRRLGDAALLVRERDGLCLGLGGLRLHAVRIRRGFAESSTRTVPCGSDGRSATAAARRGDGRRYELRMSRGWLVRGPPAEHDAGACDREAEQAEPPGVQTGERQLAGGGLLGRTRRGGRGGGRGLLRGRALGRLDPRRRPRSAWPRSHPGLRWGRSRPGPSVRRASGSPASRWA